MREFWFAATLAAITTFGTCSLVLAQDEADQKLGKVHFATTCNEVAQRRFDRAMRYQHSFWYAQSKEIYEEAIKADAGCAIAYWGIALSLLNNPHSAIPAPNLPLGLSAIEKAKEIGAKSERERDYIDALSVMYVDYDKTPQQARVQSYLKKMEALAAKYPDDDEAQIFYAITLNVAASPADKTYANQLKGAAILEPIWQRQPFHPGVAHYLIHLYDYPPIAAKGLPAALRYAKIAPQAPHAQHMPSHIFTRVGYWKESIAANLASVEAAKVSHEGGEQLHGEDYLVYAYLQLGQDENARGVIDRRRGHDARSRFLCWRVLTRCRACALRVRTRRLEGCEHSSTSSRTSFRKRWRFLILPARSAPHAPATSPPRAPMLPNLSNFATVCARPKATIGRVKSMYKCRRQTPGSSTPTANTTMRWRP